VRTERDAEITAIFFYCVGRLISPAEQRNAPLVHCGKAAIGYSLLGALTLFLHQEAAHDERVHSGAEVRAKGVGWRMDDGFAPQVNDVFMTTGTPVRLPNSSMRRQ